MIGRLIRLESRALLRQPVALLLAGIYLLLVVVAVANGAAAMERAVAAQAVAAEEAHATESRMEARLAEPMPPEDAVLTPVRVRSAIIMPVPRLVDFSIGRAGFEATSAQVGLRSRPETLFRQMRLDNPALLARGGIDLGLVAVIVAPLLLVVLGAGLFAPDRETGAARLVLVEGGSPRPLLIARSVPPLALVLVPLLLAAFWLLATGPALPGRILAALVWLAIVLFWLLASWSAMLFLHSLRVGAETAAFIGIGGWALLTLLLPAALVTAASLAHPPPSRFAEIATARAAEVRATKEWDNSHTEAEGDAAATRLASLRKGLAVAAATDASIAPIRADFADALDRQQAFVRAASWAAPPLAVGLALEDAAATGTAAYGEFRAEAGRHLSALKADVGGFVEQGRGLSTDDLAALPAFAWNAAPPRAWPILPYLALLTVMLLLPATRGFQRPLIA